MTRATGPPRSRRRRGSSRSRPAARRCRPPSPSCARPGWEAAEPDTRLALEELAGFLGEQCFEAPLPAAFDEAAAIRERINFAEMAKCYFGYERRGRDQLSERLRAALDAGKAIPARDYIAALDWPEVLNAGLDEIFTRCDAILAPAAPGPAPDEGSTGSPIFNGLWTLCGVPAVTLPLLEFGRQAHGRAAHRPPRRRRPPAAHRPLADGAGPRRRTSGSEPMTDLVMRLLAFAVLAAFLGILVWHVPRLDLGAVVLVTLAFAGYDFFFSGFRRRRR